MACPWERIHELHHELSMKRAAWQEDEDRILNEIYERSLEACEERSDDGEADQRSLDHDSGPNTDSMHNGPDGLSPGR